MNSLLNSQKVRFGTKKVRTKQEWHKKGSYQTGVAQKMSVPKRSGAKKLKRRKYFVIIWGYQPSRNP